MSEPVSSEKRDKVTEIIMTFNDCSNSMEGLLYFPTQNVGVVIEAALALRREITRLENEVDSLKRRVERMNLEAMNGQG